MRLPVVPSPQGPQGRSPVPQSKKILYAASTFGHLKNFHLPYIQALHEEGHQIWCAAQGDSGFMPAYATCVELPFTKSYSSPCNISVVRSVARLMRRERFDVVLTHTSLAAFFVRLGIVLAGKGSTRVVNTVHGYLFDDASSPAKRAMLLGAEKLVAPVTDLVVTMNCCDTVIAAEHGLGREPVVQVPGMGVPLDGLRPAALEEKRTARQELGLPQDAFVLLCAAEFSGRKNQGLLIEALAQLPPSVLLALPGTGERLGSCRDLAASRGVAARVLFPGHVNDLASWRAASDLCVSSSRSEGLPFHVIEAMACGLPAVLTQVKGHEDLVCPGENGLLFPFGDASACADCIRGLFLDRLRVKTMGEKAVASAKPYDLASVQPQLLELYRS